MTDKTKRRNSDWTLDELTLALEVYLTHGGAGAGETHPDILALSNLLRKSSPTLARMSSTFRNPAGVSMKLENFTRYDPLAQKSGLPAGNRLESVVWETFSADPKLHKRAVRAIKARLGEV
jgi:5-methylcytosine-specific restriction enzyme A